MLHRRVRLLSVRIDLRENPSISMMPHGENTCLQAGHLIGLPPRDDRRNFLPQLGQSTICIPPAWLGAFAGDLTCRDGPAGSSDSSGSAVSDRWQTKHFARVPRTSSSSSMNFRQSESGHRTIKVMIVFRCDLRRAYWMSRLSMNSASIRMSSSVSRFWRSISVSAKRPWVMSSAITLTRPFWS